MPNIIISPTAQLQQVDDFPDTVERTVEGAMHIRPGATYVLSDGEASHLASKGIKFSVSGKPKAVALSKATTGPAPVAVPAPTPLPGVPAFGGGSSSLKGAQGGEQK
jgi:hypothetical protein